MPVIFHTHTHTHTHKQCLSAHHSVCAGVCEPDKEAIVSPVMKRQGDGADRIFNISPYPG